jgi:molecular chaperone GrpE
MINEEEVDNTDQMRKKKDEPREIPIKISGDDQESGIENISTESPQNDSPRQADLADDETAAGLSAASGQNAAADLQAQIDALTQERASLYDQMLRRQAEFENYRRRTERERGELYDQSRADVIKQLLPVIDNFERALSTIEHNEGVSEGLRHGIELIHKQFKDTLTRFGLQPIESVGQAFDPNLHEAVTVEPTDEHEENTVVAEFERGYKLGDKLLRPAKVKVAASPDQ